MSNHEKSRIEYDVRTYDEFGDCQDVDSFETREQATKFYDLIELKEGIVGKELEKHTIHYSPRDSVYSSIIKTGFCV